MRAFNFALGAGVEASAGAGTSQARSCLRERIKTNKRTNQQMN